MHFAHPHVQHNLIEVADNNEEDQGEEIGVEVDDVDDDGFGDPVHRLVEIVDDEPPAYS